MNTEYFIFKRIIKGTENSNQFSRPIIRIAIIGVALGVALMILAMAIVSGFQNEIKVKLIGFNAHILVTHYDQNASNEPSPINKNQDFIKKIVKYPDVDYIQPYAIKNGIIKTKKENEGIVLKGIGSEYNTAYIRNCLIEGSLISNSDTVSKGIVISKYFSDKLHFKLNDKVVIYFITEYSDSNGVRSEVTGKDFYVTGIYKTDFEEIDKNIAIVDIQRIQKINRWDSTQVAGFEIQLHNFDKLDELSDEINLEVGHELLAQNIKQLNPTLFSWLEMVDVNAVLVLVLMVLVASINMIATLLILIMERSNMIGLLKTLGTTNKSLRKIFLFQAFYILLKGLFWGNLLAIAIEFIQLKWGIFTLNAETYYISKVPINFNITHILTINFGTIFICMIMLLLPTMVISKISPAKSLKFN